jgi:hypothetical protein
MGIGRFRSDEPVSVERIGIALDPAADFKRAAGQRRRLRARWTSGEHLA